MKKNHYEKNPFIAFSLNLAAFLAANGHAILEIRDNVKTNDGKKVYLFEDSPELRKLVTIYSQQAVTKRS